jgi:uncharacterized membrane protein
VSAILLFIVLRAFNVYGDAHPWTPQASPLFSFFSFLNCTKYPPSLLYLLMTLGPSLCLLALWHNVRVSPNHPLLVFGRVPMFFYILHLYAIHTAALLYFWPLVGNLRFASPGYGVGLPGVYLAWVLILIALYPACRWYAGVKRRSKNPWLSYL